MAVKVYGGGGPGGAAHGIATCLSSDTKPTGDICYGIGLLIELDTNKLWKFVDEWVELPDAAGASWGTLSGTLSDQTDLQNALNGKSTSGHNHDSTYSPVGHHHDADYAPIVHDHAAADIADSTAVGRSVLTAADQAAARDAIGAAAAGGGTSWGGVTGTLSNQTDLQAALDGKASTSHNHDASYEPKNANIQAHVAQAHAPANAQKNSDITKAEIEAKLTGEISSHTHAGGGGAALDAWPVGSVYIAVDSTSPATRFGGGTWSAFGAGKVLVGLDSGDADFDTAEETGGAKTVTLTAAQSGLPQHTHVQDAHSHVENNNSATTGGLAGWAARDTSTSTPVATGYSTATTVAVNQNAGPTDAAQAHPNMPPYIVVYMWKRTA